MNFQLDHLCTPPETESNIQCNILSILWGAERDCEIGNECIFRYAVGMAYMDG